MNRKFIYFALLQLLIIFGLLWVIAGNDRLFRSTVPIEQRLVSRNESIRKKAQQELLGLDTEGKKRVAGNLIPSLEQPATESLAGPPGRSGGEDPFVRKWAAISLALVGPAAQEAIPVLLQGVSAKEKDVAQAARVALSEIGAPDAQQLPSLLRTLQDPRDSVRCEAALSIGKMGPAAQEAVPLLIGYVQRQDAAPACFEESLGSLASSLPSVYGPVLELLSSGHVELRRKAAHVLELAGPRSPDAIRSIFDALSREADPEARSHLAKALQLPFTPEPDKAAVLAAALHDEFLPVRLEAAQGVRQSAPRGPKSLPLILRMLRDPEPSIRRLGLETLRRSGLRSPDLLQKVGKAQRDTDAGVRCRAAETLIESGSTDRVSIALMISDLRLDEDTARCAEEVLGLAGLFDNEVMRSMARLVQEDPDPDIRSRAARVLMHLGPRAREAIPALLRAQKDQVPGAEIALRAIRAPAPRRH